MAGDPLARGEGQAGGIIPTTTDEEAVHGVSVSHIRECRREQDRPVEGTKTSTLVLAPAPPDRMIPGMEIIIRELLPVLLTLCSRSRGSGGDKM